MPKYHIVRFYMNGNSEYIKTFSNLFDAQEYCRREDTKGEDWFDGYTDKKPMCEDEFKDKN